MKTLFLVPRSLLVIFVAVLLLTCWLPVAQGAVDLQPGYAVDIGGPVLAMVPAGGPLSADIGNDNVANLGHGPSVDWVIDSTGGDAETAVNPATDREAWVAYLPTNLAGSDRPRAAFLIRPLEWPITAAERDTAWAQPNGNGSSQ